jgi:hypothetical protein
MTARKLSGVIPMIKERDELRRALGSVWIQREFMTAAAILIMAAKL